MALLSTGPQFGVKYTLTGPDGATIVFNDPTDPNYVGVLTEITGFDSPEVRENADNIVELDGGVHGNFYYGRRPLTMTALVYGHATTTQRNARLTALQQATNAMRGDCVITWTPDGGEQQFLAVRRQQPLRVSGAWNKEVQLALVAADPRIYSSTLYSNTVFAGTAGGAGGRSYPKKFSFGYGASQVAGQLITTNSGSALTYPILTITGPGQNPAILNNTTGQTIAFNYTLGAGETLVVDTLNRTVLLGTYPNLIINPDFETDASGWSAYNSGGAAAPTTFARQNGWAYTGSWSLRITSAAPLTANQTVGGQSTTTFSVTPSHIYNISGVFDTASGTAGAGDYQLFVEWRDSSGAVVASDTPAFISSAGSGVQTLAGTTTAPASASKARLYARYVGRSGSAIADFYVDRLLMYDVSAGTTSRYSALDFQNTS